MDNVPPHTTCMHAYIRVCLCVCVRVFVWQARPIVHGVIQSVCVGVSSSLHICMYVNLHGFDYTHAGMCVCVDNSAAGELSKSDQRLHVPMQVLALSMPAHIHTYIHRYSCARVCVRISFTVYALCLLFCLLRSNLECAKNRSTRHIFIWPVKCVKRKHIYLYN